MDPFPVAPINALRIEGKCNFNHTLWQKVTVQENGSYILKAEFMGIDTTNVDVCLFIESSEGIADVTVHPTAHAWQEVCVKTELKKTETVRVGVRIVSPPGYGMVRRICLVTCG